MEKILTISVAAYNVEKFLENTLNSLSDSRYVDKLEVFVVDDGGTDSSLDIASSYEERYPQTFHAVHKENGGYGSTVNYSIAHATGKYFKLLDGDDWMDRDGLCSVLDKLEELVDDVVVTEYFVGPSETELSVVPTRAENNSFVYVKDHETSYPYGMWAIFYRTQMLKECGVVLPEHTLYTDQVYSTVPFSIARTIRFINTPVYCYRFGREEQSTSKPSRIKHAKEMMRVCDFLYDFYEKNKEDNKYLLSRVSRYYIVALKTLMIFPVNKEGRKRFMKYEAIAKKKHPDLYAAAVKNNSVGTFVKFLRRTGYRTYWMIRLIPEHRLL